MVPNKETKLAKKNPIYDVSDTNPLICENFNLKIKSEELYFYHHSFLNVGNLVADVNRDMVKFFVGFAILHFFHAIIFLHHCKFGIIQKQPPL